MKLRFGTALAFYAALIGAGLSGSALFSATYFYYAALHSEYAIDSQSPVSEPREVFTVSEHRVAVLAEKSDNYEKIMTLSGGALLLFALIAWSISRDRPPGVVWRTNPGIKA